jgi:integrase
MGRPKKCWSVKVGARGHSVFAFERVPGGPLWLRWWVPKSVNADGQWQWRPLKHTDRVAAEQTARTVAAQLMSVAVSESTGRTTLAEVLATYRADVCDHLKGQGPKEAKRRIAIWAAVLGAQRDVATIDFPTIERFIRDRRAGTIVVEPYKLKKSPTDGAIGADVVFLESALNHATRVVRPSGARLLLTNPIRGFQIPRNKNPRRPVASYDRFLKVAEFADAVDPQKLFGAFMGLVEGLGWRVSAICALRNSDVDLKGTPSTPHGRIQKRPEFDKEGVGGWLPMSESVRAAVECARSSNSTILAEWPLFPAPIARTEIEQEARTIEVPKSWSRYHARSLLSRAEMKAGLDPLEGSDFHAYRRKWATERKHLPAQDVAEVGAWRDLRTMERAYQQTDASTILAVVNEPRKLRDAKADEAAS